MHNQIFDGGLKPCEHERGETKKALNFRWSLLFAEREGFEPPDLLQSTVFKTAAFDRSAISPAQM